LAFDEILSTQLVLSEIRQKIKKIKKTSKKFVEVMSDKIINSLNFDLTKNQKKIINEINIDLKSKNKMFRLLQGDVGSGKTIIALICAYNVIQSGFQVAFMAPTGILAEQHFNLAKKIFCNLNINFDLLIGSTDPPKKKLILSNLKENKINIIFGTHALFQKKIIFNKLGLIIIDEQHKFGVRQRMSLSLKGGDNCDILLMSATPIPRTLMMSVYGDMDVSRLVEKPANRKEVITLSKPDKKIDEIIKFVKKEILIGNQVFWVCPLIDLSKKIDHESAVNKYKFLNNIFPNIVGLIHGSLDKEKKEKSLKLFLNKKYKILVSTTVIEVGIDFPNANIIIIENSNKFGLSQLHQLRGRVGRGTKQGLCILMYKNNLSENAKKRIRILKSSTDGFIIADEDMKLRGFGDILGYKQSGIKEFRLADPIHHQDLFELAGKEIKKIEDNKLNFERYRPLLKLYDLADIITDLN
jgi:ATP-dependent DNA helicase RecG